MTAGPDIFLSYNREDQMRAKLFADAFAAVGLTVWWDTALRSGEAYDEVTEAALRAAKAVVVLWSPRSVASRWVRAEATIADRCKTLVPVMIEPCERPIMFELTQTADLSRWTGEASDKAWQLFLGDVQHFVRPNAESRGSIPVFAQTIPLPSKPAIAVLPFRDLSNDPADAYLAEGMMEEINNALTRIPSLIVIASGSGRGRVPDNGDFPRVGRELGVGYLLDATVQRIAARIRISVKLIEASTSTQIWTGRFDGSLEDVFAFQDLVAFDVAGMIDSTLQRVEIDRAKHRSTNNSSAYDLFLQGFSKTLSWERKSVEEGVELLERALALDPDFSEALALAGFGWHQIAVAGWWEEDQDLHRRAIDYGKRAVRLTPENSRVLAWAGVTLMGLGSDVREAERLIEKAIAICPGSAFNLLAGSWIKAVQGDFELAMVRLREMRRLDPVSIYAAYVHLGLGVAHFAIGQLEDAIGHIEDAVQSWPEYPSARGFESACLYHLGRIDEARQSHAVVPRSLAAARMLMRAARGTQLLDEAEAALGPGKGP